ncbi:DNA polymerase III subunit delta' [Endozoicomonas sp. SCSIO W0465]|uniref:DNA polymerase III subunit delta' n=1 Tax=Endozoicomonas sp. SCSIO W0465 TaxID=2918516 RepID=UPI002074D92C|nr:DNA polymerase III subunit delta' [Endozoicomonas sp. SCSIO W0465]USE34366.1 DNA polymerase III subunit delta' [Endozoicomonas sp. SCSIO W0465]
MVNRFVAGPLQAGPLTWQKAQWQPLIQRMQAGLLSHALLLKGVPGVGKDYFASALATRVLCHQNSGEFACGHCKSCELVKAETHPDLLLIQPEASGKPIKIDQIRQVNDFARKTAQQGGRRVIVINPAEAMNINAANALLKSLEEPGGNTLFILVSARSGDMLPTIRSRCQMVSFTVPDLAQAKAWLSDHIADLLVVDQLLSLSSGSPMTARTMFDNDTLAVRGRLFNAMPELFRGNLTPVEMAKEWHTSDLIELLAWMGSWLDDAVKLKLTADESCIMNRDLIRMLDYIAKKVDASDLLVLRDKIMLQRQQLLEGANLNRQMLMEGVFSDYLELVM